MLLEAGLKSDYFRIETPLDNLCDGSEDRLKSDYFRIETEMIESVISQLVLAKIRLF
ncbi:hypothetical protein MB9_0453 [Methanobacterium formicicum]|uniref:Uncharacterized protein n=1 Tax=Methanobacterium formicicum TaxID=2162 RepID=A0A0S4FQA9_METFO|nr:hypothetical protein MB9_0453 [Methanobacterium formicicum]